MKNFTDYEIKKATENLERDLDRCTCLLNAWKGVTRNYKKNGEPFANLKQNFNGCTVKPSPYSLHSYEKEISVCTSTKMNGYITDEFSSSETVNHTKFTPSEDRIIKESFLTPYFYLTVDEIEKKIQDKISYYEKRVEEIEKAIEKQNIDIEIMSNLLKTMAEEIEKLSPDMATFFKREIIRSYY